MTPGPFSGTCSIWAGCSNLGSGGTVADVQEVAGLRNTMHGTLKANYGLVQPNYLTTFCTCSEGVIIVTTDEMKKLLKSCL
jgi:hypothetical protein